MAALMRHYTVVFTEPHAVTTFSTGVRSRGLVLAAVPTITSIRRVGRGAVRRWWQTIPNLWTLPTTGCPKPRPSSVVGRGAVPWAL